MNQLLSKKISLYILTHLCCLSFIFLPNNKIYLAVFAIYGLFLFFFNKFSLIESVFAVLLLSLPFERGIRGWFIDVVFPERQPWIPGYSFYFGITPKLILICLFFAVSIFYVAKRQKQNSKNLSMFLITFLLFSLISSFSVSNLDLAFPGLVRIFEFTGIFIAGRCMFTSDRIRGLFPHILTGILLVYGFVGSLQTVLGRPIGLFLEDTGVTGSLGYITTDSIPLYRAMAFTGHPTYFGSLLSLLLPLSLGIFLINLKERRLNNYAFILNTIALIVGLISLIGTFSRSAWIAVTIALTIFLWKKKIFSSVTSWMIAPAIIFLGAVTSYIVPTILYRVGSLSDILYQGNGRGRLNLISQALDMIKGSPLFGVGLNHFTMIMAQKDLSLEARTFLYPVHNTFLLFFAELGIPAGILFTLFVFLGLKQTWRISQNSWLNFGIWIGAATFVLNSQFHTLFNLDPSLDIFITMLAYLSVL